MQKHGCAAVHTVCCGDDAAAPARKQRAAEAGALEAVVEAMHAHPQWESLQEYGCLALGNMCCGDDAAAPARKQRAAEVGSIEAVVKTMQAHPQAAEVQVHGYVALRNMLRDDEGDDAAVSVRIQRAEAAGVREAMAAALKVHPDLVQFAGWPAQFAA